jgi:hypothetical protein
VLKILKNVHLRSITDYTPCKTSDWVQFVHLRWSELSRNPRAIRMLEQNLDKIDCNSLLENPQALLLIEQLLQEKTANIKNFVSGKIVFQKDKGNFFGD